MPKTNVSSKLPNADSVFASRLVHRSNRLAPTYNAWLAAKLRLRLEDALADLPLRERVVVRLRFGFDGPSASRWVVGDLLNLPPAELAAIESSALERLRVRLAGAGSLA